MWSFLFLFFVVIIPYFPFRGSIKYTDLFRVSGSCVHSKHRYRHDKTNGDEK